MKTKIIRSTIPIYLAAAIWILYGLAQPLYRLTHILLATGLSLVTYFVASKFLPGRKVEVQELVSTGDAGVDKDLNDSLKQLDSLRAANKEIASGKVSAQLDRMVKSTSEILTAVSQKPDRAGQVRRFLKYYLPTTTKLMEQYKTLSAVTSKGEQIGKAMTSVENSLDMIAQAFEKQLDTLYRDDATDITSDVQVLETMMKGDGLTDEGIMKAVKEDTTQCQTSSN